jgi:hypothetical protein
MKPGLENTWGSPDRKTNSGLKPRPEGRVSTRFLREGYSLFVAIADKTGWIRHMRVEPGTIAASVEYECENTP